MHEPDWYIALLAVAILLLILAAVCGLIWWRDVREDKRDREAWSRMPGGLS